MVQNVADKVRGEDSSSLDKVEQARIPTSPVIERQDVKSLPDPCRTGHTKCLAQ